MVTIFTRESEKKHKVEYNKYGNLKSWEFYGTNGKLFSKTRFEYIYDEQGNWTELKIIQDNGKVKVKVEKTIEYRS